MISLSSIYPNVSFELTLISRLKITDMLMSQLLVNKPKYPEHKLKTMNSGYLTLDENSRLVPISSKESLTSSYVGIWVYGLDLPNYQASSDESEMVRASEISIRNNKEEYKLSLIKSPFLWASLIKFLIDENINKRVSTSKEKDSFILVHFMNQNTSPQFYEFSLSSLSQNIRNSTITEAHGVESMKISNGTCTLLSLNGSSPYSEEVVNSKFCYTVNVLVDKISRIIPNKCKNLMEAYTSKTVRKCIKDYLKRKAKNRSNSRQSVGSSRMTLHAKGSLSRLTNTIDASKDSFGTLMRASVEKPLHHPESIRLKLISDQIENIPANVGPSRGRNTSFNSILPKTTTNTDLSMNKSNTLTRLRPNASNEF